MSLLLIEKNLEEIQSQISNLQIQNKIESFRLPGFKQPIFDRLFINYKNVIRIAKHRYHSAPTPCELIKSIKFNNCELISDVQLGDHINKVHIFILNGIPISNCDQIIDWNCTCKNPQPCLCTTLVLLHCIDKSPTTFDLCNDDPFSFSETKSTIDIGDCHFDKASLPIKTQFSCSTLLNKTKSSLKYFQHYVFVIISCIAPICDHCQNKYEWNQIKLRWIHYCKFKKKSFLIHPLKSNSFFADWDIGMLTRFVLFIITFGLDLPFTKQTDLCNVESAHTLGRYFGYFGSVCQLLMICIAEPLVGPIAADGCYDGTI